MLCYLTTKYFRLGAKTLNIFPLNLGKKKESETGESEENSEETDSGKQLDIAGDYLKVDSLSSSSDPLDINTGTLITSEVYLFT